MIPASLLETIYGTGISDQQERYDSALAAFIAIYGQGPVDVFRAPGRVNLIGEHTDYNHGYVLPLALDRDVVLLARTRSDAAIHLQNVEAGYSPRTFDIGWEIPPAPLGDWSNYARGAAQMVAQELGPHVRGMDVLVVGAAPEGVPRGAGLSSSSALTVVIALALAQLNGWLPEPVRFARLCSDAEWYVGTRGGIMDQFISLLAVRGRALFLDCRPSGTDQYTFSHVSLLPGYSVLVVDSGVHHANVRGEFNLRVAACRTGVACLRSRYPGITHLRDVQHIAWDDLSPYLPPLLTVDEARAVGADLGGVLLPSADAELRVRACCRHVHSENARVRAMVVALKAGDVERVGGLLDEAHAGARDDYGVSCPELEALVRAAHAVPGTIGARLTGAGWGGCIVALVRDQDVLTFESDIPRLYREQTGLQATVFACQAGSRAGHVIHL